MEPHDQANAGHDEVVHLTIENGIATITLDSQHNRNALSRQLLTELHTALDTAEDAGARAIVLRHEGPAFCAGADLKERRTGPPDSEPFVRVLQRLMDTAAPTIAVVDGAVRAGGIGLMAACDLVIVNTNTTFALTEVRIGVAAAIISVPILQRVPPGKIAAAMLTGEQFDAEEARSMGLVTHVSDDTEAATATLCEGILMGAPKAVTATKRILHSVAELDRDQAFETMRVLSEDFFASPEAAEGMKAFAEKRRPVWSRS